MSRPPSRRRRQRAVAAAVDAARPHRSEPGCEVDRDAPLGPHELRVATPQGVSSVALVVVVDGPVVIETDAGDAANDRPASARKLSLPVVVSGRIGKAEDVDWYAFELTKGERVGFEVWGNRLENKIHDLQTHLDPILSLHDSTGRELAAADNNHYADPVLTFQAPSAGTYFLQVRDTTYAGNPAWGYALLGATGPITTSAYPLAVNPGTTALLELHGPGTEPGQETLTGGSQGCEAGRAPLRAFTFGKGRACLFPWW